MENLSTKEIEAKIAATTSWLHQRLTEAIGVIASLEGDKAALEYRLANPPITPESEPAHV